MLVTLHTFGNNAGARNDYDNIHAIQKETAQVPGSVPVTAVSGFGEGAYLKAGP